MQGDQFSFNTPLSPMRLQSQLGKETKRMYKEGKNVVRLSLARVAKVNYKYNTVDVVTTLYKNTTSKNPTDNGRYSARLPVAFGGRTPDGKVYGSNTLVTIGCLVLIGFLEGDKDHPIVLNIYGDADNQSQLTRTSLSSADESDEAIQKELWQLFTLYPSMTYENIDGRGNKEVTFSGRSFMYITDSDPTNAYVQDAGFDYQDLPNSKYANGEQIEPTSPQAPTVLYVHQGVYDNHKVTFFIKSDGTVRLGSRHLDGKGITFQEMGTDGSFMIMQKKDGINPEDGSQNFSKFEVTAEGEIILQSPHHKFEIVESGVLLNGKPIGESIGDIDFPELDEILNEFKEVYSSIEVTNEKIESKVGRIEYDIDLSDIREYAKELSDGVRKEVDDIVGTIEDLDDYLDGAFADGIIEEAEANAIQQYLNTLRKEKGDLDVKYTQIVENPYLDPFYANPLQYAKTNFDTVHEELINTILLVISDKKVTGEEKAAVDQAFANYTEAVKTLRQAFERAIDAIAAGKAKEALDNAKDHVNGEIRIVNSTITQLADSITNKVESEVFTNRIKDLEATLATKEEAKVINDRVGNLQDELDAIANQITYRADVYSSNGLLFQKGDVNSTLYCRVYRGPQEITNDIPAANFKWTRVSNDAAGDAVWNQKYTAGPKSITITSADVPLRATFNCDCDIPD